MRRSRTRVIERRRAHPDTRPSMPLRGGAIAAVESAEARNQRMKTRAERRALRERGALVTRVQLALG